MGPTPVRVESAELYRALLEVPNDPKLTDLILNGGSSKEGRSGDLFALARKLGELGVGPSTTKAVLELADLRWGKFSARNDFDERLEQLLTASEEVRPKSFLEGIRPVKPSQLKELAPTVEWLIEDRLALHTYGLITGSTGVGKSQLGIQLAVSLAKGINWLNQEVRKSRVLYCSLEMGFIELQYFSDKIVGGSPLNEDEDILHYLPVGEPISVLTEPGKAFYLQFIDDYDVFIFDTVSASTHLPMLDEATAVGIVAFFTQLTVRHGKTVVALGHDVKSIGNDKRAESMYGHRLLMDRASMVLRVDKAGDDLALSWPKVRLAAQPDTEVYERDATTLWLGTGHSPKETIKVATREEREDDNLFE